MTAAADTVIANQTAAGENPTEAATEKWTLVGIGTTGTAAAAMTGMQTTRGAAVKKSRCQFRKQQKLHCPPSGPSLKCVRTARSV